MQDDGCKAVLAAVVLTHLDPKEKNRCFELVDHFREVFDVSPAKHVALLQECLDYQMYILEAAADLPPNQNLVLNIFNDDIYRQHTINHGETYRFELGYHRNYRLKFAVARFNGEKRKAIVRSSSLIKRMMSLDKREGECIQLNSMPMNSLEKRSVCSKGHCYTAEMKIVFEIRHEQVPFPSFEDLLDFIRGLHEAQCQLRPVGTDYDGELDGHSFSLLHAVSNYHQIPAVVIKIAQLCVFMVWDPSLRNVDDSAITRLVAQIRVQQDDDHPLLVNALSHLSQCVAGEMEDILRHFEDITFFPPDGHHTLKKLNLALKTIVDICVLSLWDRNGSADPSPILSGLLAKMVHRSAGDWVTNDFQPNTKDIRETCLMIQAMWEKVQTNYQGAILFFHQFNINYLHITFSAIDHKLEESCRAYLASRLLSIDTRCPEQLEMFSKCTMKFYETLAEMSRFSLQHRVKHLRLHNFEDWFQGIPVYWTYSWRQLSSKMIIRTASLTKDQVDEEQRRPVPAALYSFLCIQKGLSDDYIQLSLSKAENVMMGTIALVHILSENTCHYGLKLSMDAGTNINRVIRAINGIEQSFDYVEERYEKFVDWEKQRKILTVEEQTQIRKTAETIISSSKKRCDDMISSLLGVYLRLQGENVAEIAKTMCLTSAEYTKTIMSYMRDLSPRQRVHETLEAVDQLLYERRSLFMPRSWGQLCRKLFDALELEVVKHLKKHQHHDYYGAVYVTLKAVMDMLEVDSTSSKLSHHLHWRSFSTEDLLLALYGKLAELAENATDCPKLNVQLGCVPARGNYMLLVVNVLDASLLPSLNPLCDRVDPYVKLELVPQVIFPEECFPSQKTKVLLQTGKPVWAQTFQFLIPEQLFFTNGTTLRLSLLDSDRFCDQLLGRGFLPLSKIERVVGTGKLPPSMTLPLIQPSVGHKIMYFQLLKERALYDKKARQFLMKEGKAREMYAKVRRLHCKVKSKYL